MTGCASASLHPQTAILGYVTLGLFMSNKKFLLTNATLPSTQPRAMSLQTRYVDARQWRHASTAFIVNSQE
jgi:hypothetical protein